MYTFSKGHLEKTERFLVESLFLYLTHKLFICIGDIIERENTVAEFEEEVCAEADESPEWKLEIITVRVR